MTGFRTFEEMAQAEGWSEERQKKELLASISDLFKYVHGWRPRGLYGMDDSVQVLLDELETLAEEADEVEAARRKAYEAARKAFEAQVRYGLYKSVEEAEYDQSGYPSAEAWGLLEAERYAPKEATFNPFAEALKR